MSLPLPAQRHEEEEIVAQVSSLINNMDVNQQNKLMSQIMMENPQMMNSQQMAMVAQAGVPSDIAN